MPNFWTSTYGIGGDPYSTLKLTAGGEFNIPLSAGNVRFSPEKAYATKGPTLYSYTNKMDKPFLKTQMEKPWSWPLSHSKEVLGTALQESITTNL